MTARDLLKLLKANGWELDRVRGSHHILVKGSATVSVPVHGSRDVPKGTLHAILKEAGIR
ncbi:MAG: type II toxin-antitoxin system HicA family toxin [Spirochaetaceae bacterium]|nr:type II toxin-antitoxin system HicA family toxin [Spirochaetaceae bacterium]